MKSQSKIEGAYFAIRNSLADDIVSMGEVFQILRDSEESPKKAFAMLKPVLSGLLSSGVEIGCAINPSGSYVEFVAWRGDVKSKISRLIEEASKADESDRPFVAWLSLPLNVDRYES